MSQKQSKKLRRLAITRREYKRMKHAHKPQAIHLQHPGYARRAYMLYLNRRYVELTRKPKMRSGKERRHTRRNYALQALVWKPQT